MRCIKKVPLRSLERAVLYLDVDWIMQGSVENEVVKKKE